MQPLILFLLLLSSCVVEKPETTPGGLTIYKSSNIIGYENKPIIVDSYFVPSMNKINEYAKKNNVVLYVTSSYRKNNQNLTGTIVPPVPNSNHLVGHAIDMNIYYNHVLYESKDMKKSNFNKLPSNVKNFLNSIRRDPSLRWGGDFPKEDPVHIDDHLNKNTALWQKRYAQLRN